HVRISSSYYNLRLNYLSSINHFPHYPPSVFFFFNDPATTELYTLSLHDALPICADGVIDDPRRCPFDPARDLPMCAGVVPGPGCVTEPQARALKKIYGGVMRDGKAYFPGQPLGAEKAGTSAFGEPRSSSGWDRWLIGRDGGKSLQLAYSESFMR